MEDYICECGHDTKDHSYSCDPLDDSLYCDLCDCSEFCPIELPIAN